MNKDIKKKSNKKIPIIIFIIAVVGFVVYGKITNHLSDQWFLDRITAANFQASDEISELVKKSGMNNNGKLLFYASEPEINENQEFNQNCKDVMDKFSTVMGCYNGRIYIFDVKDERIIGTKYVTAAHEMLHAAYDRLGIFEKKHIDELISNEISEITDQEILDQLELYKNSTPGHEINEMHSILATESRNLSPELEKYYERYFSDRDMVLNEFEKYKKVFSELQNKADDIQNKMSALELEIETLKKDYETQSMSLSNEIDDFNLKAGDGYYLDENSFYVRRNEIIAQQDSLLKQVDYINQLINQYNNYVVDLQGLGRDAQTLQNSLDSQNKVE